MSFKTPFVSPNHVQLCLGSSRKDDVGSVAGSPDILWTSRLLRHAFKVEKISMMGC